MTEIDRARIAENELLNEQWLITAAQEIRSRALEHAAYAMGVNVDIRDYANIPGHVLPVAAQYERWIRDGDPGDAHHD